MRLVHRFNYKLGLFWVLCILLAVVVGFAIVRDLRSAKREAILCSNTGASRSAYLYLNQLDSATRRIKGSLMITDFSAQDGKHTFGLEYMTKNPDGQGASGDSIPLQVRGQNSPWYNVDLPYKSTPFFYPFESYDVDLRFTLMQGATDVPLKIQVTNFIDELVLDDGCMSKLSFDEKPAKGMTDISFVMKRHHFVRVIAVILYSVAIVFLIYIARKEEANKILTNSLGYMAALWGIRQIIVGYAKLFPTIVDLTTLALYVLVVGIVAYTLLFTRREPVEMPDDWD